VETGEPGGKPPGPGQIYNPSEKHWSWLLTKARLGKILNIQDIWFWSFTQVKFRQLTYYFWVACSTVWSVHTPIDLENPLMKNVQEDTLHQKMTQGPVLELACVPDLLHPGVHWNGGDQYVKRLALLGNDRVRDPKITQPRPPTRVKWLSENRLKCDSLWPSMVTVSNVGPRTGAHQHWK